MASFEKKDKRTYAVFVRTVRNGRPVLVREQYNMVEYGDGVPYVEPLPMPGIRLMVGSTSDVNTEEVIDDIRIYNSPPKFNTRFGTEAIQR